VLGTFRIRPAWLMEREGKEGEAAHVFEGGLGRCGGGHSTPEGVAAGQKAQVRSGFRAPPRPAERTVATQTGWERPPPPGSM